MSEPPARRRMLAAIRDALRDVPAGEPDAWSADDDPDPAAAYTRALDLSPAERTALFAARCGEYRAVVRRCAGGDDAIRDAVAEACAAAGTRTMAVAPGVPASWIPSALDVARDDPPLSLAALDGCDGALTGASGAIALTGTIVLDGSPLCGRRALTLVPDLHVCVVAVASIAAGVPQGVDRFGVAVREHRAPITLVSGPSATSDIELARVEGVHGPRRLHVVVAG